MVNDTSLDALYSDFTIQIKDENGNIPSAEGKPSSSGRFWRIFTTTISY